MMSTVTAPCSGGSTPTYCARAQRSAAGTRVGPGYSSGHALMHCVPCPALAAQQREVPACVRLLVGGRFLAACGCQVQHQHQTCEVPVAGAQRISLPAVQRPPRPACWRLPACQAAAHGSWPACQGNARSGGRVAAEHHLGGLQDVTTCLPAHGPTSPPPGPKWAARPTADR